MSSTLLPIPLPSWVQNGLIVYSPDTSSIPGGYCVFVLPDTTFRVGTSLLNPAKVFMDLWYLVNKEFPEYKLHLVLFKDNHEGILGEIAQLGKKFDFLRIDLERHHPEIQIEDTPQFYDISVFNRCSETGKVLLTLECWKDVHPGLVSIPVDWEYSIPYGLLYSFDAPGDVLRFVEMVQKYYLDN